MITVYTKLKKTIPISRNIQTKKKDAILLEKIAFLAVRNNMGIIL